MLNPDFFTDPDIVKLTPWGRLLLQGLMCLTDEKGEVQYNLLKLKIKIFPGDNIDLKDIESMIINMKKNNLIKIFSDRIYVCKRGLTWNVSPFDKIYNKYRDKVFERDNYQCQYCGSENNLTIDHIKPRSRGGLDIPSNLVTACFKCNLIKNNRTPKEAKMFLENDPRDGD